MPGIKNSFILIKLVAFIALFCVLQISTISLTREYETSYAASDNSIKISFVDVGQGDSILIHDSNGFDLLIDGGVEYAGPTVLSYLRSEGIDDVDVLLATHADSDHVGGLITVLNAVDIPVESVYFNGYDGETDTWDSFTASVVNEGLSLLAAQFPSSFQWGLMNITVINPVPGLPNPVVQNDASIVLLISFGQNRLLLTGDISSNTENQILTRGIPVNAQILKVAHHGSKDSSGSGFLTQVAPQYAVISVGDNNYGHPAPETLDRLQDAGSSVWRTDQKGTIVVNCNLQTCIFPPEFPPGEYIFLPEIFKNYPGSNPGNGANVNITTIYFDGNGTTEPDEFVEIVNDGADLIQLQNWTLSDKAGHTFTFPEFSFQPGQICRVYTNEIHSEWCGFSFNQSSPIWNNSGDCAYLRDLENSMIDEFCYLP